MTLWNALLSHRMRRISLFAAALWLNPPAVASAAFETFSDPEGEWLAQGWESPLNGCWKASITRTDRYALPELGVTGLNLRFTPPRTNKRIQRDYGLRALFAGDEIYSEWRAALVCGLLLPARDLEVKVWAGNQGLNVRNGPKNRRLFVGGRASGRISNLISAETGLDGLDLPYEPDRIFTPVGWMFCRFGNPFNYLLVGGEFRSGAGARILIGVEAALMNRLTLRILASDHPGRLGGSIALAAGRFKFSTSYSHQPVVGWTRRLGTSAEW